MKDHFIDIGAGLLAGFIITSAATFIGFLHSAMSFWSSLVVLDVVAFFSYAQLPFFAKRRSAKSSTAALFVSFIVFTFGAGLAGVFVAYYIAYLSEHSPVFFL